ncbi:hypothetical protein CDL15_Pgr009792 [Punica granatum]|uniref:Uncharacterized protein n=1 Tax=Punica granatum TaxID=22663 RepID=A0A218WU87_PUNGR|nr:hypothetical protein CDL15_Pgr009792 [Punica granatum]
MCCSSQNNHVFMIESSLEKLMEMNTLTKFHFDKKDHDTENKHKRSRKRFLLLGLLLQQLFADSSYLGFLLQPFLLQQRKGYTTNQPSTAETRLDDFRCIYIPQMSLQQ